MIANAQNGDTIVMNAANLNGPIVLNSKDGALKLTKDVTIESQGGTPETISGNNKSQVFEVANGANVTLFDLTITQGFAASGGGIQIDKGGDLNLDDCTLTKNSGGNGFSNGEGGGAILKRWHTDGHRLYFRIQLRRWL